MVIQLLGLYGNVHETVATLQSRKGGVSDKKSKVMDNDKIGRILHWSDWNHRTIP